MHDKDRERKERLASLLTEIRKLNELEDRSEDQETRLVSALAEAESIKNLLSADDRYRDLEAWASQPNGEPPIKPDVNYRAGSGFETAATGRPGTGSKRSYRSLFPESRRDSGGWANFGEFARQVSLGLVDDRLKRSITEGLGTEGGFTVPSQFTETLFDLSLEDEIVRKKATIFPMTSNERKVPGVVIGDHSSSLSGGIVTYWKSEGADLTESTPTFRNVTLKAEKLTALGKASGEWVADNVTGDAVERLYAQALGFEMDYRFFQGSGAGEPLGILRAPCTIEVSAEGGQGASTIVYENLVSMMSRMHPACFNRSMWIANVSTIPQLLTLSIVIGAGGSHVPVMKESNGSFSILTRPVIFTEKLPELGTKGDIILADLSQYYVGLTQDIRIDTSKHVGFASDELYFRAICRVDGQPSWDEPLTLKSGTHTVSPFIVLEDR